MPKKVELVRKVTERLLISLISLTLLSTFALIYLSHAKVAIPMLPVVIGFGMAGGFISIQRRLKALTTDDLELLASSWPYIFLPPFVGGSLAIILYLVFISGLLSGQLFPSFETGTSSTKDFSRIMECIAKDYTDYAKLLFWSFVAGFSETFVTDIIGTFATAANRDAKKSDDQESDDALEKDKAQPPPKESGS